MSQLTYRALGQLSAAPSLHDGTLQGRAVLPQVLAQNRCHQWLLKRYWVTERAGADTDSFLPVHALCPSGVEASQVVQSL
jgi:hypothetical protein